MIDNLGRFKSRQTTSSQPDHHRVLEANTAAQGTEIEIGGKPLINFCSNDYLGLANHPAVSAAAIEGIERYGVGAGAAPLLSGQSAAHERLADQLARFLKRERALLFSSGYLANLGVLAGLTTRQDIIFHDKLNHASLIDGVRLSGAKNFRYPHVDTDALASKLSTITDGQTWVVSDGVFSMDGDLAPLSALAQLARTYGAMLVCDDAHGFGVLGHGRGTAEHFGLSENDVPLLMVTFGKALGTVGAAVVGPATLIDELLQVARTHTYDTALPPAIAHATAAALQLVESEPTIRDRLFTNIQYFHDGLALHDLPIPNSSTPIQPFIIGDSAAALAVSARLRECGIYARAVRPPTVPHGTARLRICLSAAHTPQQIDRLLAALVATKKLRIAFCDDD